MRLHSFYLCCGAGILQNVPEHIPGIDEEAFKKAFTAAVQSNLTKGCTVAVMPSTSLKEIELMVEMGFRITSEFYRTPKGTQDGRVTHYCPMQMVMLVYERYPVDNMFKVSNTLERLKKDREARQETAQAASP